MKTINLITIITPVFNESASIERYFKKVFDLINNDKYDSNFEIIITDNCSTDDTFEKCLSFAKKDKRIKLYRFIKNYGYQKSIYFGYCKSNGDCVMQLDCDLQDPIEMLDVFIENFKKGYDIVYGVRAKRSESLFSQILRKGFYRLVNLLGSDKIPNDAGDFMLVSKKVIKSLKQISHQNIYIRGEIFSLGLLKKGIPYKRDSRIQGNSKFKLTSLNLLTLAKDGILSQSNFAIRISVYFFIFFSLFSFIISIIYLILKLYGFDFPDGYVSLIMLMLFISSINSFFFSIIGEYIYRIYSILKNSSECITQEEFNVNSKY